MPLPVVGRGIAGREEHPVDTDDVALRGVEGADIKALREVLRDGVDRR
jgi:hypothetical protein